MSEVLIATVAAEQFGGELTVDHIEDIVGQLHEDPDLIGYMIVVTFDNIDTEL